MSSSRANLAYALAISFALHALFAVALGLYLNNAPAPDKLAQLDLTGVDLSFSETFEETPPADAVAAPRPAEAAFPPPRMESELPSPEEAPSLAHRDSRRETRDERQEETRDEKPKTAEARTPPQRASAPRQARVDAPPKPRRAIRPDYPRESRLRGEQGEAVLELDVAADGSVSAVRVVRSSGHPLLDEAAVRAARGARFTPAEAAGETVASTVRLPLDFKLK